MRRCGRARGRGQHVRRRRQTLHARVAAKWTSHPLLVHLVGTTTEEIDYVVTTLRDRVARLRDLSPLWDMYQEGVDISSIQWAAH